MKKYILTFFAVAAVLSSCSKSLEPNGDINSGAKAITTIGASTEISTRAKVSSDGTKVNWEAGDQIGVLGANDLSEAKNLAYTLNSASGSTSGTFTNGNSDINAISAVMYPYQASATWDDTNSKLTCEIPPVQTAVNGSFDKAAAVMYSIDNTTNVQLKFAVNFLMVTVSETNVHAISISSLNALSGKMEITTSLGVTAASSGSLKSVTLTAGEGNVLAAGDYYIAVKAGDIENPTISYVYLDQINHTTTEKSKAGNGTLSFASGKNVKPISVTDWTGATERKAVQLWADGPKFAEYNVGASSATETGIAMTFTDAIKAGAEYEWGPNWRTPSKENELDELLKAATSGGSTKVDCNYIQENGVYGFKFTGNTTGYTSNSVFFPSADGNSTFGSADYWSATAIEGNAWRMSLFFFLFNWNSSWIEFRQDFECYVRPVLKN